MFMRAASKYMNKCGLDRKTALKVKSNYIDITQVPWAQFCLITFTKHTKTCIFWALFNSETAGSFI